MRTLFRVGVLSFALCYASCATATAEASVKTSTDGGYNLENLQFRQMNDPDVLALGDIRVITQDAYGFIWIGGSNGLARWDGYQYRFFKHDYNDPASMTTYNVNDLAAVDNGDIWVATYWGLNRYNASTERFERYNVEPENPRGLTNNSILQLKLSRDGALWLATDGGGLLRYRPASNDFDRFQHDPSDSASISGNAISEIEEDADGLLWVGIKEQGVDVFDPVLKKVVKRFRHDPNDPSSLSNHHPTSIQLGGHGEMWVGTYHGINLYQGDGKFKRFQTDFSGKYSLPALNINRIMVDSASRVWVAAGDQGIALYRPEMQKFMRVSVTNRSSYKNVNAMFSDSSGALWVGFFSGGMARLDRYASAFENYEHEEGNLNSLSSSDVFSIAEDKQQNFWVGTRGGLNFIDRRYDQVKSYSHDDPRGLEYSLPSASVSSVVLDDSNTVWVGTTSWEGMGRLDLHTQTFQHYRAEPSDPHRLLDGQVWSLYRDTRGYLWAGTSLGGLHRYRPESNDFIRYLFKDNPRSLPGRPLSIDEDSSGNLWVSTDFGLVRLKSEYTGVQSVVEPHQQYFDNFGAGSQHVIQLDSLALRKVFEDSKGNIWMATGGGGLNKWDVHNDSFHVYMEKDGIVNNNIASIEEDDRGYLWISTEDGLSRMNPDSEEFTTFTRDVGLPGNYFNYGASLTLSSGDIAFGGRHGLTIVHPDDIFFNEAQAPVVLTNLYLFNRKVEIARQDSEKLYEEQQNDSAFTLERSILMTDIITLDYKQSVFTLEYSMLNFDAVEKNRYIYKLEGFDESWTEPSERRSATYTNLNPGRYIFRVKGMNSEGIWSEHELAVALHILPPWWATIQAKCFYGLLMFGLVFSIVYSQYSRRQFVENQNKLLEEKINERTAELQAAYKTMEEASYSDALTGLRNRRYLYDVIDNDVAKVVRTFTEISDENILAESHLAFYLIDVDFFKSVNDTYGHANGDKVLTSIADALMGTCRESDLVIRWGGEEFLVVSRYVSKSSMPIMAERIRKSIESTIVNLKGYESISRTASIGYTSFPFDPHNPKSVTVEQTVHMADRCLYSVKENGRNGWAGLQLHGTIESGFDELMAHLEQHVHGGLIVRQSNIPVLCSSIDDEKQEGNCR